MAKEIANDQKLINLIFKCIADIVKYLNKEEQFDLLIMSMSILLNIFDSSSISKFEPLLLAKDVSAYDIIIQVVILVFLFLSGKLWFCKSKFIFSAL